MKLAIAILAGAAVMQAVIVGFLVARVTRIENLLKLRWVRKGG